MHIYVFLHQEKMLFKTCAFSTLLAAGSFECGVRLLLCFGFVELPARTHFRKVGNGHEWGAVGISQCRYKGKEWIRIVFNGSVFAFAPCPPRTHECMIFADWLHACFFLISFFFGFWKLNPVESRRTHKIVSALDCCPHIYECGPAAEYKQSAICVGSGRPTSSGYPVQPS